VNDVTLPMWGAREMMGRRKTGLIKQGKHLFRSPCQDCVAVHAGELPRNFTRRQTLISRRTEEWYSSPITWLVSTCQRQLHIALLRDYIEPLIAHEVPQKILLLFSSIFSQNLTQRRFECMEMRFRCYKSHCSASMGRVICMKIRQGF
jgi:hypothetical protein